MLFFIALNTALVFVYAQNCEWFCKTSDNDGNEFKMRCE